MPAAISLTASESNSSIDARRPFVGRTVARVLAVWAALAVGAAVLFVGEAAALHRTWTAGDVLARLAILPLWALATPFILRSARRRPIRGSGAIRNALAHLAFGSAFLLAANVVIRVPMVFRGSGVRLMTGDALAGFLHFYPGGIAVYAAIVAFGGWRSIDEQATSAEAMNAASGHAGGSDEDERDDAPSFDRPSAPPSYSEVVPVKTALRTHLVPAGEIDWIEGDGDHVVIHRGAEGLRTRTTMKSLAATLDPTRFVRVHRSAVVRLAAVKEIQPYFHGDFVVILHSGATVRLARSRRRDVEALLGNRL